MKHLDFKLLNGDELNVCNGVWYIIQWTPNIITDEKLNIGILFHNLNNNEVSIQMLDYYERIKSLYSKSIEFKVNLACSFARELLLNGYDLKNSKLTSQIEIVKKGFAQGESTNKILESLYKKVITLHKPIINRSKNNFLSKSRDIIYNELKDYLKINLDLIYDLHVPEKPYVYCEKSGYNAFAPYIKNTGIATLVSAVYSDTQRIKCNLFDGYKDIEISSSKENVKNNAIFILKPNENKKNKNEIENEIDKFQWIMNKQKIRVYQEDNIKKLSDNIAEWCLYEKAV